MPGTGLAQGSPPGGGAGGLDEVTGNEAGFDGVRLARRDGDGVTADVINELSDRLNSPRRAGHAACRAVALPAPHAVTRRTVTPIIKRASRGPITAQYRASATTRRYSASTPCGERLSKH